MRHSAATPAIISVLLPLIDPVAASGPEPGGRAARFDNPLLVNPLLVTTAANSSSPVPTDASRLA